MSIKKSAVNTPPKPMLTMLSNLSIAASNMNMTDNTMRARSPLNSLIDSLWGISEFPMVIAAIATASIPDSDIMSSATAKVTSAIVIVKMWAYRSVIGVAFLRVNAVIAPHMIPVNIPTLEPNQKRTCSGSAFGEMKAMNTTAASITLIGSFKTLSASKSVLTLLRTLTCFIRGVITVGPVAVMIAPNNSAICHEIATKE